MRRIFRLDLRLLCATLSMAIVPLFGAGASAQTAAPAAGSKPGAAAGQRVILVVGDSLSAEYGIARGTGWVPLLQQRLAQRYPNYRVVNASISGDTTSGGVTRMPAALAQDHPAIVIIELGSNDALRGFQIALTEQNLRTMAQAAKQAGAQVLLVGMQIPPNFGRAYTEQFKNVFPKVAQEEGARLVPFLLDGVAQDRSNFQEDGLHPLSAAQPRILENVWAGLQPMLTK
jgi:acyl-CoA thioesterase-1